MEDQSRGKGKYFCSTHRRTHEDDEAGKEQKGIGKTPILPVIRASVTGTKRGEEDDSRDWRQGMIFQGYTEAFMVFHGRRKRNAKKSERGVRN